MAEILACSLSQVYALKDRGLLPFVKIGGMVRFREEDIQEMVNSHLVEGSIPIKRQPPLSRLKHLEL